VRQLHLLPGAVGLLLAGTASGGAGPASVRPDPLAARKGSVTYQRYCTACHGPEGHGDGTVARELRTPPPDLTTIGRAHGGEGGFPYERVVRFIDGRASLRAHGTPDMPVWGEAFSRTQGTGAASPTAAARNLAHYLWSLQAPVP